MTCCTAFVYGPSPSPTSSATSGRRVGHGDPSLDLLPLEAPAGPPRPRDAAARERRPPRMANQTSVPVEQRVVPFALGHPGFGPARIAAELSQPRWGELQLSANGVWRVLRRHGLNTRARRYGWSPATPPHPSRSGPPQRRSGTWTSTIPASWSSWTASASAGSAGPRAPSGRTAPSTWPRPTPGPPGDQRLGTTGRPPTSRPAAGGWSG
jgi:hypothetical protein